jgi:hypothetical protein
MNSMMMTPGVTVGHHGDTDLARACKAPQNMNKDRNRVGTAARLRRRSVISDFSTYRVLVWQQSGPWTLCCRAQMCPASAPVPRIGANLGCMANDSIPGEQPGQLEALLERWQTSLDLHARYASLDDARYWHVQPWPKHERPQRWIIQLARKRILALKRLVVQRQSEGDRAFIEGIEIMSFLATLVGLTSVERFIPLATHETERRDVLSAKPEPAAAKAATAAPRSAPSADTSRSRTPAASRTGEHRRTAETTRQMPVLATSRREAKRDPARPATIRPQPVAKPAPPF